MRAGTLKATMKDRTIWMLSAVVVVQTMVFIAILHHSLPEVPQIAPPTRTLVDPRFIAPEEYRAMVMQGAAEFGIPLDIAIRLAFEESGWDETAMQRNRNGSFDHGLYQLNSRYHRVKLTPANIHEGLRYLRWCWDQTGTLKGAVMAYNAGLTGSQTPTRRTRTLAEKVVGGRL